MIEFNTRFDNTELSVTARVEQENPYWSNTTITRMYITTIDNYRDNVTPISDGNSYDIVYNSGVTSGIPTLTATLNNDTVSTMFLKTFQEVKDKCLIVWVQVEYLPASSIPPCGADKEWHMTIVYNKCPIINEIVKTSKEVEKPCDIPKSFIDTLLRYEAFKYAILAKDWDRAIKYWNKFYNKIGKVATTTNCGCHG